MISRIRRRPLAALVTLLFLLAPSLARAAHDRAHERDFGVAAPSAHDGEHGHDHEPPTHPHQTPDNEAWPTAGRDHADSGHQTGSLDDGLTCRIDCFTAATTVRAFSHGVTESRHPPPPATERRGDPTHHPPTLPRAPPQR